MRSAACSEKISVLLMAMKHMTGITVCFKACSRKARMRSPRKRCNVQMRAKILMNCPLLARSRRISVFVIEPTETTADDASEVKFILDVHNLADKLKPYMPKQDKKASKQGKTIISAAQIVKLRRQIQNEKIKEKRTQK